MFGKIKEIKKIFCFVVCCLCGTVLCALPHNEQGDSTRVLDEVVVSSFYRGAQQQKLQPLPTSQFTLHQVEQERVQSIKDLSAMVPNFYIPDYGSKMTSSMYVRGLGARIDNPVMGLYVDGVPYFNKSNFDFDFCDIRRITVLRGPQGTLFGRNTMGGVIDISTLSPFFFQGTRVKLEGGSGNTFAGQLSTYSVTADSLGLSASLYYKHSDGFYTNSYDGSDCDRLNSAGLRLRVQKNLPGGVSLDNSFGLSGVEQGGYPYRLLNSATAALQPVNYNDECGYRRLNLTDGLSLKWQVGSYSLTQVASYQYTHDNMRLDQDFTPKLMFTLKQLQDEHLLSDELILKPTLPRKQWNSMVGFMAYGRYLKMQAPVTFKRDGIEELILKNANSGIQTVFPDDEIRFEEDNFVIRDNFKTHAAGAALFFNVTNSLGDFSLEWGTRFEVEKLWFNYDCSSLVHYRFTYNMADYKPLNTLLRGNDSQSSFEWLPRLSLSYKKQGWRTYLSFSKGYKSGGFNTQLFSDLLQNCMSTGLMADMGLAPVSAGLSVSQVMKYKPEHSYNYETGISYGTRNLNVDITLFYMDCRDQQLTVFPAGTTTGRMMTNAGRTRNYGVEVAARYSHNHVSLYANYGYTNATFRRYVSGNDNYRGNNIPYVPQHTVAIGGDYALPLTNLFFDKLVVHAAWRGFGPICWDEANRFREPFYGLFNGSLRLQKGAGTIEFWCENIADTEYNVFYFVSMKNSFMQQGKPRRFGVTLSCDF